MEENEKKNMLIGVAGIAFCFLIIGAGLMWFAYPSFSPSKQSCFIGEDANFLVSLAYQTGHCERLGLVSKILPQQLPDSNITYGVPICVESPNYKGDSQ